VSTSFDHGLLNAQLNRLRVLLQEITELTPQRGYRAGLSRCPNWPVCKHPGCELLRDVQKSAAAELARIDLEYRDPRAAAAAVTEDAAALDFAAEHEPLKETR